ncbi:MAG: hypothetical protein WC455_15430 [Dehalococcoidia bacterium]|jgi:hypothetical protein
MKSVIVEWLDASFAEIQANSHDAAQFEPITMRSVGFLFAENDNKVVICQDDLGDTGRQLLVIPRCSILRVKEVK